MTCRDIGGIYVDEIKRKEELVKMIEECENEQFLTFLYSMIISFKNSFYTITAHFLGYWLSIA